MRKQYKISIMEINIDDDYEPKGFREFKEKCLCYEDHNEEYIFNRFMENLPKVLELFKNDKIEWHKVVTECDKKQCY